MSCTVLSLTRTLWQGREDPPRFARWAYPMSKLHTELPGSGLSDAVAMHDIPFRRKSRFVSFRVSRFTEVSELAEASFVSKLVVVLFHFFGFGFR